MTTLIAVYNSDGCVGRCDAKCYDAQHDHCECICGGKNHGAGKQQAIENTREMAEGWLERYATDHELKDYEGMVGMNVVQKGLFEE